MALTEEHATWFAKTFTMIVENVAKALLGHLKAVNTMITPNAGSDAAGWSSYLIDVEEKRNG